MMSMITIIKTLIASLAGIGCGWLMAVALQVSMAGGGHPHEPSDPETHHSHQSHEPAHSLTHVSDHLELFLEFEPLVAGHTTTMAAHFTQLESFRPITSGVLNVYLNQNDRTRARFRVSKPAQAGIYFPAVNPRQPGEYELIVELTTEQFTSRHALGTIPVYSQPSQAKAAQHTETGTISFSKEQQWQSDFAIESVQERVLRPSVPGFGTVMAPADGYAEIRAPDDGYYHTDVMPVAGTPVARNDVLGMIVPRLGDGADVGDLLIDVERAKANFALAKADVIRLKTLFEQGSISEKALMEAEQEQKVAQVQLETVQNRLNQRSGSGATTGTGLALKSPLNAELLEVNVVRGAYVKEGELLFSLVSREARWLNIQIPEKFAVNPSDVAGVWFSVADRLVMLDTQHQARVVKSSHQIHQPSRTIEVAIEYPVDNGPSLVGARFPVNVSSNAARKTVAIPATATIDDDGQSAVYVQTGGESFERRAVTLGIRDGDWWEILDGVKPGERVVARGAYLVKLASMSEDAIGHGHAH